VLVFVPLPLSLAPSAELRAFNCCFFERKSPGFSVRSGPPSLLPRAHCMGVERKAVL